jgi:hypothetical protein
MEAPGGRSAGTDGEASALSMRASDRDRDQTVEALREHAAVGRLTLEELSERTGRALEARTLDELAQIRADLPSEAPREKRRRSRLLGAIFGNTHRTGRWRLGRRATAFVLFGDADLDLREASLDGPAASLGAFVLFGNVDVYVPEALEVDFSGLCVFGHRREWGRDAPTSAGAPLVHVRVFSLFGTADLWRVPPALAGRSFGDVIAELRKGGSGELPPPADG